MTNVLSYLENSFKVFPDKIAFADTNSEITFSQLQKRAMSVATNVIKYVKPRQPVVFLMEKSTLTMTGFMGAVYAGCFYVLIDPRHPVQRIQTIINTLDAKLLITDAARRKQAEKMGFEECCRKVGVRSVRGQVYDGLTFKLNRDKFAAFCEYYY